MTLAPDLAPAATAPAAAIPLQLGPSLTVSLTQGCETPLEAIRSAGHDLAIRCHPCDEAVVRLLLVQVRRGEDSLVVSNGISPGTLRFG